MNFNITTPLTELISSMSNTNKMIATNFNLENDSFSFEINGVNFLFRKIKSGEFRLRCGSPWIAHQTC